MRTALVDHLWSEAHGRFARSVLTTPAGPQLDATVDASLTGLVLFGALDPDDPKARATLKAVTEQLAVKTDIGGLARYTGDTWHRVVDDPARVPGNPWFITALWVMRCEVAAAQMLEQLDRALRWMRWVAARCLPSGVLAEQVHPLTGEPLSVSPLSWSHAEVVAAMVEYLERRCCMVERGGKIQHMHHRGRYADRYMSPHCWEDAGGLPPSP
jgi:GH15 family glucan-1,4-alpha-glucosidase